MDTQTFELDIDLLKKTVEPWHQSLADPEKAQEKTLEGLLKQYSQTEYGRSHGAEKVGSYEDFKKAFPPQTYEGFKPWIDKVINNDPHALLHEKPFYFNMTKGSSGESKFFPNIPIQRTKYLDSVRRIYYSYALHTNSFDWLSGYRLSLNSNAALGSFNIGGKEIPYGYAIAVTIGLLDGAPGFTSLVTPTQKEINSIPGESSKEVWGKRHELAYRTAKDKIITHIHTSHNVLLGFARYLKDKYQVSPKDLWDVELLVIGGFPGANTRFASSLKAVYGRSVGIRDFYISSESTYGGQIDNKKAWAPFYDLEFFEVQTINGIKPLYELRPGEIGSLIVSTDYFPRYRIRDLILAFEPPYFRCVGRENLPLGPYRYGRL